MSTKHCVKCGESLPRHATRCHACNSNAPEDSVKMIKWGATVIAVCLLVLVLLFKWLRVF